MKHFSMPIILGVLLLVACADKKEAATEQNDTAPSQTATAEPRIGNDDQEANADAPPATKQNSATAQAPDAVEKNAPKFAAMTDHLALKEGEDWSWQTLASMPKIQEWQQKLIHDGASYYMAASFDDYNDFSAYGTEHQPKVIVFGSGQGYAESETLEKVSDLEHFFRPSELTRVKSNCDTDTMGMFVQQFYKWQKKGGQPLYLVEHLEGGNSGSTHRYAIAKSFDDFFDPDYNDALPNLQNPNDDDAACTFEL